MEYIKDKNIKMEINDTKYEGEWTISNFSLSLKDRCTSPCFFCDFFRVKLTIGYNDRLEIIFKFDPLIEDDIDIDYIIKIINIDDQKSYKIDGNEIIDEIDKECKILPKIPLHDINYENGFLQNESLQISFSFKLNENLFSSQIQNDITKEAENTTDWYINENIEDFHSTEEPIETKINDTQIKFALTFEKTENDTFLFSLFLIEPTISFNSQLTVILHNQISSEKSIAKQSYISFTPKEYDIQPISFDLSQGQLSDHQNGWMMYDEQTHNLTSGLHFTIQFDSTEKILNRFSLFKIETERKLFDKYPTNISRDKNLYQIQFSFERNKYNFFKPYASNDVQVDGIILNVTVNFKIKTITFNILESLFKEGQINVIAIFNNSNHKDLIQIKKKGSYSKKIRYISLDLPFAIGELLDDLEGWMQGDSLNFHCDVEVENCNVTCLYPIKLSNSINNGFYGIKYFIPISLFSKNGQQYSPSGREDQILFNSFYTNCLAVTPIITFNKPDNSDMSLFKLKAKTNLQFKYFKKNVKFDILVTFVNIDKAKNVQSFFSEVSKSSIDLPDFNLNKTIKEEGFQFIYDSTEAIEMDIVIHIYNDNYNDFNESEEHEIILDLCKNIYQDNIKTCCTTVTADENMIVNQEKQSDNDNNNQAENEPFNSSKKDTGYVGLCNQGATCYLNSYLQTLFHLPAFRRIIYSIPTTENDNPNTSIPLNIQRLFYQMEFEEKPCSTVNLTRSFGWNSHESFQQHDIQEFSRVLIDNLEKKLKGTNLEDSISKLFKGRFRSYIKCKNVDYTSINEESFYDLSMDVKGIQNLCDSFKNYINPDQLSGPNKYDTEKFGKQDAIMGTEFLEFPPILQIHLRRFMLDQTNGMIKINDRFDFPLMIDLTEYLADDSPQKKESNIYDLYGVLVHSGNILGGHYYAFLRTSTDKQWYKFNDSFVTKESVKNAVYDNFGSNDRTYSGYMLIYVRRNDAESLYKPINYDLLPDHLKTFKKKNQKLENSILVHFIHEDCLKSNTDDKNIQFFRENGNENDEHIEEYDKSTTTAELYLLLGSFYNFDPSQFRLWICFKQKVPRKVIIYSEETTLEMITKGRNDLYIFVQPIKENEKFDFRKQIMVYVYFIFSENLLDRTELKDDTKLKKLKDARIQFLFSFPLSNDAEISSIVPFIIKKLNFHQNSQFDSYLAQLNGNNQKLNINSKPNDYGLGNGSILIFEMKQESIDQISKGSLKLEFEIQPSTENSVKLSNSLKLYSDFEFNGNECKIFEVYNYRDNAVPLFRIKLPINIEVIDAINHIINVAKTNKNIEQNVNENEFLLFRFYFHDIEKLSDDEFLDQDSSRIYFLVPSHNLKQTEITVQFSIDAKNVIIEKVVSLKDCMNFDDVFNRFKSSFNETEKRKMFPDDKIFRYLIIQNGSIEKVVTEFTYLEDLKDGEILRIEIVPDDQVDELKSLLFNTFYSNPESSTKISFLFVVVLDEIFSDTKKRLLDCLNLQESNENLNFYLYIKGESFAYNNLPPRDPQYIIHDYSVLKKNDDGIIKLDDSSYISDFIKYGHFLMQILIINDKFDELKKDFNDNSNMKKISLESYTSVDE